MVCNLTSSKQRKYRRKKNPKSLFYRTIPNIYFYPPTPTHLHTHLKRYFRCLYKKYKVDKEEGDKEPNNKQSIYIKRCIIHNIIHYIIHNITNSKPKWKSLKYNTHTLTNTYGQDPSPHLRKLQIPLSKTLLSLYICIHISHLLLVSLE